jgi:nicotinic acid phosphoribosyltransferase
MLQFIWKHFPETNASFSLINRSVQVRLGDLIGADQLREQLEQTKKLRFHKSELIWLAGNTFYGHRGISEPAFLEWLDHDFRLSDFDLSVQNGQFSLTFHGLWIETTMWEIYTLSAISELKTALACPINSAQCTPSLRVNPKRCSMWSSVAIAACSNWLPAYSPTSHWTTARGPLAAFGVWSAMLSRFSANRFRAPETASRHYPTDRIDRLCFGQSSSATTFSSATTSKQAEHCPWVRQWRPSTTVL